MKFRTLPVAALFFLSTLALAADEYRTFPEGEGRPVANHEQLAKEEIGKRRCADPHGQRKAGDPDRHL